MRHRRQTTILATGLVFAALGALPSAASAANISGRLDAPGLSVLAVAPDGTTESVTADARGRFSVPAPAAAVTLHLREADGGYGGPIVLARRGETTQLIAAGTRLGLIDARTGWGVAGGRSAKKPTGAGRLGLVRVRGVGTGSTKPGQDQDRDGIINAFDVDDDGDLVLDNVEGRARASSNRSRRSGRALPSADERRVTIFSNLKLSLESSLNANAGSGSSSMTRSAVNAAMTSAQTLAIKVVPGDEVELDCGGLGYCSSGGTGRGMVASASGGFDFPDDYDADGDGFGTIERGPTNDFQLITGAEFDEIGAGDTFLERVTVGTTELEAPGMLNFVFTSTPAVTMWSDGAVNHTVSYPVAAGTEGTAGNPAGVQANADGDIVLTFTMWRPQRPRIAPTEAKWMDLGGLGYSVDVPNAPSGGGTAPGICQASTLTESDASLSADGDQLRDSAVDRAADPANTITFTVNMTDCLGSGASWDVGETLNFDLQARTRDGDNAAQKWNFVRTA